MAAQPSTTELARGQWAEILPQLGVDAKYLRNRHGPCPACGGEDRFRFDDKEGDGTYYCNQCGAGGGLKLLMLVHGWEFERAAQEVDRIIGRDPQQDAAARKKRREEQRNRDRRREQYNRWWKEARVRDPALEYYLHARGLSQMPGTLRYHPSLPYYDSDGGHIGDFPAMLALIVHPKGDVVSMHRTYLTDQVPKRKKVLTPVHRDGIKGGAIRLYPAEGKTLAVAEGIETAIAVFELLQRKVPVWAAISAGGMAHFVPPPEVKALMIFGDCDATYTGQAAAYKLAQRCITQLGVRAGVKIPPNYGTDWLDELGRLRSEGKVPSSSCSTCQWRTVVESGPQRGEDYCSKLSATYPRPCEQYQPGPGLRDAEPG